MNHKSPITNHQLPSKCQERRTSRSRGMPSALGYRFITPVFAFACSSYPCSGFPEPTGVFTTHRPEGSRNSRPMTKPSLCGRQYATRARARKSPGNDSISNVSLGRQRRMLDTRAPLELTFSVNVVSTAEIRCDPEMWTATVIGILFSKRSTLNGSGIISLGAPFRDRPRYGPASECCPCDLSCRTVLDPRH